MDGVNARVAVLQFHGVARRLGVMAPRLAEIEARAAQVGERRLWQILGRAERLAERLDLGLPVPVVASVLDVPAIEMVEGGRVLSEDLHAPPRREYDGWRIGQRKDRRGRERGTVP